MTSTSATDLPAEQFLGPYFMSVASQSENDGCQTISLVAQALGLSDFGMEVIDVKLRLIDALREHWGKVKEEKLVPLRERVRLLEGAAFEELAKIMKEGFEGARRIIDAKAKDIMRVAGKKA